MLFSAFALVVDRFVTIGRRTAQFCFGLLMRCLFLDSPSLRPSRLLTHATRRALCTLAGTWEQIRTKILRAFGGMMAGPLVATCLGTPSNSIIVLWGDIGLARNMCKFQPHKPGPTQTPCAPPVRELWVACSATQELPTPPSYAPKTLEQKRKSVGTKKAVLEVLGQKKSTLDTQVTHWHTASKRCQPA